MGPRVKSALTYNSTSVLHHVIAAHPSHDIWSKLHMISYGYEDRRNITRRSAETVTWMSDAWDNGNLNNWNQFDRRFDEYVVIGDDAASYMQQHQSNKYCAAFTDNFACPVGAMNVNQGEVYVNAFGGDRFILQQRG
ncbi:uncharacterized protein V1513DRAFT_258736 [Lipomyces chichibuensis]|uniref:uncharacterized protein n=1 Tax=Lipomyces chichibuensis TaxID=1546026 RepID=UPI00334408DC